MFGSLHNLHNPQAVLLFLFPLRDNGNSNSLCKGFSWAPLVESRRNIKWKEKWIGSPCCRVGNQQETAGKETTFKTSVCQLSTSTPLGVTVPKTLPVGWDLTIGLGQCKIQEGICENLLLFHLCLLCPGPHRPLKESKLHIDGARGWKHH